jgi:hypothetical protein
VIYLTVSMTCAVRALSVFLTVWLTAAAAFPPCCWSMAGGHEHEPTQAAAARAVPAHDHHHHASSEAAPLKTLAVAAVPVHDCDTGSAEVIATPRPLTSIDLRAVIPTPPGITMPRASAPRSGLSGFAPPAALFDSAFLNPLRI